MAYTSTLNANELVIDDSNFHLHVGDTFVSGELKTRGLQMRDWAKEPFGSLPFAAAFPRELLVSRDEWDERIEEMERNKTRLTDLCDQAGLTVLDQNGTNYCWINAPTHCVEILRMVQGEQMVRLSPASCGGPIKGYRNVGGWGTEGLRYIVEHGLVPQSKWPANAIERRYDTEETRELRKLFKVQEWFDCRPRNEDELISLALRRIPSAVGYNWWSHEVTGMDAVALGKGRYGLRIDNSWGLGYGTKGRSVLSGTRHLPDDIVAPRMTTPSDL